MQHFEVDYLFGQMEQGTGSGVAKITHESKKHKIVEGSWIVKAKEKGTVVKQSIVFKMFVLAAEHEELAKMFAASLYGGQLLDASASMEQSELAKKVEDSSNVVFLSVKSLHKIADEWRELANAPASESEAGTTDDELKSLPSPTKPPPPERSYAGMSVKGMITTVNKKIERISGIISYHQDGIVTVTEEGGEGHDFPVETVVPYISHESFRTIDINPEVPGA